MEGIDTIPNTDADNALILGTALHTGIEEGVEQALDFYKNSFPVLTDDHIHEMMKLEAMIPKAKAMLPPGGTFELPIGNADFIGFMDYLVPVGKGLKLDGLITGEDLDEFEAFDLYDFKYSNNAKNYAVSGQLHEYKYWYELTHPGHRIRNMYFLIVPKPKIRQKSTETLSQFRDRLQAALKDAEPTLMPVQYNPMKIVDFLTDVKHMVEATDFPKNPNHFCGWCEYEEYCQKGWDYMLLPKNERRDLNATKKKVVWLYGAPFSGKTFFANQFPDPLMLNTDGNIKFVDAPYIAIRDTVTVEGRITKRKLAYEVFMDAVAELEKKQNDFRTIVVDLLEDVYESCRVYICDRQGWKHESDDSFRAWDMVRSEFLNTLKRLVNLDYENIILISHEDRSRDLTRKGGDKISSIKPNLQDKVANKVAGMVDLVARIVADDDERVLSFKTSEVIFGGGRLTVRDKEIPLTYYPSLMLVYKWLSRNVHDPSKYAEIYHTRLKLKAEKNPMQQPYKIVLNSTYGAMKDKHNAMYDPRQANNVCVGGQLLLLDLIERLEDHCEIIQSNTDGILVKLRRYEDFEMLDDLCWEWEQRTGMRLEFDEFQKVYQKDVNNYIIIPSGPLRDEKGKPRWKCKGAYVKKLSDLDYDLPIVNRAIVNYFLHGISPETTIMECSNLRDFQKVVKVSSKYKYALYSPVVTEAKIRDEKGRSKKITRFSGGEVQTDKTFRVFASKDQSKGGIFKVSGKIVKGREKNPEKFGNTPDHCFFINDDVTNLPIPDELDKQYYIDVAWDRLKDFGVER